MNAVKIARIIIVFVISKPVSFNPTIVCSQFLLRVFLMQSSNNIYLNITDIIIEYSISE